MPSLNCAGVCSILILAGFASNLASSPGPRFSAEQQKGEMNNESITLFASIDQKTTSIGDIACVPLAAAATLEKFDLHRNGILLLQHVRALGPVGGPYAVYIVPVGAEAPTKKNQIGEFSLYSVQQRSDSQELSFEVKATLLKSLVGYPSSSSHLQVCVENRSPTRVANTAPSASFDRALLVQLQHD